MNWYFHVIAKYATFSGRAHKKEFWAFTVLNLLILTALMITDSFVETTFTVAIGYENINLPFGYISLAYFAAVFFPSLSVTVRRLHDIGKSGTSLIILLIPVLGFLWFIDMMTTVSFAGKNKYGSVPKNSEYQEQSNYQYEL